MRTYLLALLPMLAVAGCAAESRTPPMSVNRVSPGASSQEPQPANSLPLGSTVQAPIAPAAGNVNSTRVGPSYAPTRAY